MASTSDAIILRGVTKRFRKRTIRREYSTLKSELVNFLLRRKQREVPTHYLDVLKGIDLTIPRGKTVGIIGRNGSGKSTLLKLINGIYPPTSGTIEVNGRISALLELGAGFHPDFSGRENITINGIILGMTRAQIRERTDEIIAFSELGDFIDEPVRTYSSGMYMRLAFAVATHVDPDILVIDEILAVGDEHFSKKSLAKMNEFKKSGRTIVLVTHALGTVESWCDLAVWLDGGRVRDMGDPRKVVEHYHRVITEEDAARAAEGAPSLPPAQPRSGPPAIPGRRSGTFRAELHSVTLTRKDGHAASTFTPEDGLRITLGFETFADSLGPAIFHAVIRRLDGTELWRSEVDSVTALPRRGELHVTIESLPITDGQYAVEVGMKSHDGEVFDLQNGLTTFTVAGGPGGSHGLIRMPFRWSTSGAPGELAQLDNVVPFRR
ncbi:MAG: ABC transporter ATP-binding protein [Myxococcaceae bacterium]|nr:ABC transporter ATP-binding protein [Myxococcaceae bacterium]